MSEQTRLKVGPERDDNAKFGELMLSLRVEQKLSRAEAANELDISSEFIRLIERGLRVPAAGTAVQILERYGIPCNVEIDGNNYAVIFRDHKVEFTSRIKEARRKGLPAIHRESRDRQVGRIVRLLPEADDTTLRDIYRMLKGE